MKPKLCKHCGSYIHKLKKPLDGGNYIHDYGMIKRVPCPDGNHNAEPESKKRKAVK